MAAIQVYSYISMKRLILPVALLGLLGLAGSGAQVVKPAAAMKTPKGYARIMVLWPAGAPGAKGKNDEDVPKLFFYPAMEEPGTKKDKKKDQRPAVIVLPGGGYRALMMEKEGGAEARWLAERGVSAFVLQYRLGSRYHFPAPMDDGTRAIRYVRSHASELGIAKDKVGLWGFSAGGHLAAYLATGNEPGEAKAVDPVERESGHPDFAVLSYGRLSMDATIPRATNLEGLLGDHPTPEMLESMSMERRVTSKAAPCFIYSTSADQTVNSLTATTFYDALKRAGVPAELHVFERGPHGTGLAQNLAKLPELAIYPLLVENWMEMHGWMQASK
jgi:acetyl esterase/lipase